MKKVSGRMTVMIYSPLAADKLSKRLGFAFWDAGTGEYSAKHEKVSEIVAGKWSVESVGGEIEADGARGYQLEAEFTTATALSLPDLRTALAIVFERSENGALVSELTENGSLVGEVTDYPELELWEEDEPEEVGISATV